RLQGDWSSDVCSSDLTGPPAPGPTAPRRGDPPPPTPVRTARVRPPACRGLRQVEAPRLSPAQPEPHGGVCASRSESCPFPWSVRSEERRVGKECRTWW